MSTLHPTLTALPPTTAGGYAERAVLEQLGCGLPAGFDVFHSVDISTVEHGKQHFGEIDMVVVSPLGHLLLIEVKSGHLNEEPQSSASTGTRLTKSYGDLRKDVEMQCRTQQKSMRQRLTDEGFAGFGVAQLLVLPGHTLVTTPVGLPRERIVDAPHMPQLCDRVLTLIPQGQVADATAQRARLLAFLSNRFGVCADPTARVGLLTQAVVRLSDGLATWVPRIHSDAGVYMVQATAGSGKTQLALRLLRDACAQGLRCLYVCYNRPLADHMVRVAPPRAQVLTFHELALDHWRRSGGVVNFADAGIYAQAAQRLVDDSLDCEASVAPPRTPVDLLVIDEMQDMDAAWVQAVASWLSAAGRLYVMGDPQQAIYGREPFELADAVRITCDDNVRNPRCIVEAINLLRLTDRPVVPRCPEVGEVPDFRTYPASDVGGLKTLRTAVIELRAKGVAATDMAIITFMGREHSQVLALESVAGLTLQKFTGQFDAAGNPVWTQGSLLADTLYRFKGQAAPYVILCEVDFATLDDKQRHKLFVGMSRAQMHLTLVLSEAATAALAAAMG